MGFCDAINRSANATHPNALMTRVMAGCFGFLTLIQFGEVPADEAATIAAAVAFLSASGLSRFILINSPL